MEIKPKLENANKGFHYSVSQAEIDIHRSRSLEEIFDWLENTNKFIYSIQTPEERERIERAKNFEM